MDTLKLNFNSIKELNKFKKEIRKETTDKIVALLEKERKRRSKCADECVGIDEKMILMNSYLSQVAIIDDIIKQIKEGDYGKM